MINIMRFQSLSRDSGRLNKALQIIAAVFLSVFQSLSRDSGRLNVADTRFGKSVAAVSIPQSGFGAFEPPNRKCRESRASPVSIPQSGFGAFEHDVGGAPGIVQAGFQSLSRDSGRLNPGSHR